LRDGGFEGKARPLRKKEFGEGRIKKKEGKKREKKQKTNKNIAGRGRGEPNQNPFLPEPVRPKRAWFSDLFKFLGLDKFKKYIIIGCIILAIVLVLIIVIYFAV
jgi:hypothetical protein